MGITQCQTDANISLYPNPTDKYVVVESDVEMKNIAIFDMVGRMVDMIDTQGNKYHKCNLENYKGGSYLMLLNLVDGQTKRMHLLVVK